ncbi:hypothetical protein LOK46_10430 [Methylobacterium sp. NMS14P]|uniref:hypothetical protein n=1 Tax=Methylobacterium sp. NMS14P TaxID=2894310 RepID=UPI00235A00CF|nr:hypothetical protein [Methylobacterium sp. NMS14P]WCS27205.1 hypothetical protein LOK46_10430 [Methylobacterium sp. NMS14P]
MMGVLKMLHQWLAAAKTDRPSRRGGPPATPRVEAGAASISKARQANDRAALGLVLTSGQAMSAETRIQASMAGMLRKMDRAHDAVD